MPSRSRHVGEYINRAPEDVYAFVSNTANLPMWAAGLDPGDHVTFVSPNELGVLDHVVTTASGQTVAMPMRVIPDGSGSEVVLTVRRPPGTSDADFDRDVALVEADLATLKRVLEAGS
jgi:C-terminal processing protease CtpA/Prc